MPILSRLRDGLIRKFLRDPAGMGRPVPKDVFDRDYRSGAWDHLEGTEELPRYLVLAGLVTTLIDRPAVLDLGCGSGRLIALIKERPIGRCTGVDVSSEGIRQAGARGLAGVELVEADFETWRPAEKFDAIIFNESIGYANDPAQTLSNYSACLAGKGMFFISYFRSGNHEALWRRVERVCETAFATSVVSDTMKTWDIRVLRPLGASSGADTAPRRP